MSKITAELLRAMVGAKKGTRPLCDQLVEPLNLVLPAYGITTEYRIAGFLATCAPESDWLKTLREYGKGAGRKYGRAINGLVYYGRGIFQVTWLRNYELFTEYVVKNWATIKVRAAKFGYTEAPDFVRKPELLATPYWAVEAACWYWKANGLAKHADRGLAGFFGLQGLVNRGSATKRALHYEARLNSYEIARRIIADDFDLNSSAAASSDEAVQPPAGTEQVQVGSLNADEDQSNSNEQPPIQPPPADTIISEETKIVEKDGEEIEKSVAVTTAPADGRVVEKETPVGFFEGIKLKLSGWFTMLGGTAALRQYQEDIAAFGIPITFLKYAVFAALAAFAAWFLFHGIKHVWGMISKRWLTHTLVQANSTATNTVIVAEADKLEELEKLGWTVVRRK